MRLYLELYMYNRLMKYLYFTNKQANSQTQLTRKVEDIWRRETDELKL